MKPLDRDMEQIRTSMTYIHVCLLRSQKHRDISARQGQDNIDNTARLLKNNNENADGDR